MEHVNWKLLSVPRKLRYWRIYIIRGYFTVFVNTNAFVSEIDVTLYFENRQEFREFRCREYFLVITTYF